MWARSEGTFTLKLRSQFEKQFRDLVLMLTILDMHNDNTFITLMKQTRRRYWTPRYRYAGPGQLKVVRYPWPRVIWDNRHKIMKALGLLYLLLRIATAMQAFF